MSRYPTAMAQTVDLQKLRHSLAQMTRGQLLIVAQRACAHVPVEGLPALLGDLVELKLVEDLATGPLSTLEEVVWFRTESLGGRYYEGFDVNSRNCNEQSKGTDAFIAEFDRLATRCVVEAEAESEPCQRVAQAFEGLFDVLRAIDMGNDDVLFFADDGGSWSVGVNWRQVLPAYFSCLARGASAAAYADRVDRVISDFAGYDSDRYLVAAWKLASDEQRAMLRQPD